MNFPIKITSDFFTRAQSEFEAMALDIFRWQSHHCIPYKRFLNILGKNPNSIGSIEEIPFLPIEFFKSEKVITGNVKEEIIFTSSGTSGSEVSKHFVADLSMYRESFRRGFEIFYGAPSQWVIMALLPSYLEREGSSLIYMCDDLIHNTHYELSGFFLHDFDRLKSNLEKAQNRGLKTLLIGVTFALLEFAEKHPGSFPDLIVMETGGMKGRREEMTRTEVHEKLKSALGVNAIHSEYGMTELLSQAYSHGHGIFDCPPWMRILIRDSEDPLSYVNPGQTGGINVIDLANVQSCSFIATQDLGLQLPDGRFEVLGRFDHSDVRGCNLMVL